jgi:XTP/dITP diphosphohydrolase
MDRFVVATRNAGKIREIRSLLGRLPYAFLDKFPAAPAVEETGETYRDNATLKAVQTSLALKLPVLAEDSGIEVDALDGRPGIRSARYSGEGDEANNRKLLEELHGVPDDRRTCRYRCVAVFASGDNVVFVTEGTCEGVVLREPQGEGGFGYDPLIYIPAMKKTMAELTLAQKNRISHRAAALKAIKPLLRRWAQGQKR